MSNIRDIRVFKSEKVNSEGVFVTESFSNKKLNVITSRIAMKLNGENFSLGDFNHLYINFTTCLNEGEIKLSKRKIIREFSWQRYYDVGVTKEVYNHLDSGEYNELLLSFIEKTLLQYFAPDEETELKIKRNVAIVLEEGEKTLIFYKEKQAAKTKAVIYLRYLDNAHFYPLLCVYDNEGYEIFRHDFPENRETLNLGEILLSSKKVTVKPKKNYFARELESVTFEF